MPLAQEAVAPPRAWPLWRRALTALSALALALSAYLGWHYLAGGSVIGCGGGSPCEQVLSSRWSSIAGVLPVSGLAAGVYLAILVASLFIGPSVSAPDRRLAWAALLIFAGAIAGSALWFIIVQKWLVGAFCPYCMATHLTGLLLAALILWQAPRQRDEAPPIVPPAHLAPSTQAPASPPAQPASPPAPAHILRPASAIALSTAGLALAALLAVSQLAVTPPPVYHAGESQQQRPALDPSAVPLVGPPNAAYMVTVFSDYKCSHCQRLHSMLDEAVRRYDGKLAFVLSPTPLNNQCNPYVATDQDRFQHSCELARLGLAVWLARRDAFPAFNHWMFSFDSGDRWRPRTLEAATAKAVELVGQPTLDAALANPWVDAYLQTSISAYGKTVEGGNAVPKLLYGSRWVIPQPETVDDLLWILQDRLAIPQP